MRSFFEWFATLPELERPWLILGKGPSFAERTTHDLAGYRLLSLNHAVREQPVLVAHIIDLDVVQACEEALDRHARMVVMPWYPHIRNAVGERSLAELVSTVPALARLAGAGRLLWYDLSTSLRRHGPGPVVRATYFSAEAAVSLLASAGVRRIRTLGVDGGTAYSTDFDDLRDRTLLSNGHPTFDLQFKGFARTILETGVDVAPLTVPSPAWVVVASAPTEALAARVLAHTIRKNASLSVEVLEARLDESGGAARARAGGAIVLSARVHCLADIRPLWMARAAAGELLLPTGALGRNEADVNVNEADVPEQLVVMGAEDASRLPEIAAMVREGASAAALAEATGLQVRRALSPAWQPARHYVPGQTQLLYYPNDGSEPWLSRAHSHGHLWVRDLLDGVYRRAIPLHFVDDEVRRGHVRPSLLYQVEQGLEEPSLLPRPVRALDRGFRSPTGQRVRFAGPVAGSVAAVEALARRALRQARAYRAARRVGDAAAGEPVPRSMR